MSHADPIELTRALRNGDRRALAQAITLVESQRADQRRAARQLLEQLTPHGKESIRIGISGVPGVGKSTLIEALGQYVIAQGYRLAVLAVDPSSALSGGSILGDKTRMEQLGRDNQAFIRPSPTGRTLGGVTRSTREAIMLCEAAGFDVIFVETVGVGQSETAVAEMTDMFILLLLPGAGDELQGIKRGIIELADLVLINKADGDSADAAQRAAAEYRNALHYLRPRNEHWQVKVETCSAIEGAGIDAIWHGVLDYKKATTASGALLKRRAAQSDAWMWQEVSSGLLQALREDPAITTQINKLEQAVMHGEMSASVAAQTLIEDFLGDPGTSGEDQ